MEISVGKVGIRPIFEPGTTVTRSMTLFRCKRDEAEQAGSFYVNLKQNCGQTVGRQD
jgi:hypothetical protein